MLVDACDDLVEEFLRPVYTLTDEKAIVSESNNTGYCGRHCLNEYLGLIKIYFRDFFQLKAKKKFHKNILPCYLASFEKILQEYKNGNSYFVKDTVSVFIFKQFVFSKRIITYFNLVNFLCSSFLYIVCLSSIMLRL